MTFSCSPELGHIDDAGNFVVSGTASSGILTAHYGDLEVAQEVTVKEAADLAIRLDSYFWMQEQPIRSKYKPHWREIRY